VVALLFPALFAVSVALTIAAIPGAQRQMQDGRNRAFRQRVEAERANRGAIQVRRAEPVPETRGTSRP